MKSATLERPAMGSTLTPLGQLAPVSLTELDAVAALQTRVDRKYLLAEVDLADLLSDLGAQARVLDIDGRQQFSYESTYFDSPELGCYLDAARSRPNRFKLRTRSYLDSGAHQLEVKTRSRARHTVKTRRSTSADRHDMLRPDDLAFVAATLACQLASARTAPALDRLRPVLRTHYLRATLLIELAPTPATPPLPAPSRATIDTSLRFARPDGSTRLAPGRAIVETKTAGPPSVIDRMLWRAGHRPVKVSKYGTGLALLHPHLPAAKWNRILRHHFAWRPTRTG